MCERFKLCETINNNFDWVRGLDNCVHTTKVIVLLVQISAISGWNAGLHLRLQPMISVLWLEIKRKEKKEKEMQVIFWMEGNMKIRHKYFWF